MTLRKQLTTEEIAKIGLRMKSCRVLTMLNQEEFADKHNIPYTTIRNWEYGRVIPRLQGVQDFIESLKKSGVYVDTDWIMHGEGSGPTFSTNSFKQEQLLIEHDAKEKRDPQSIIETFKEECRSNKHIPVIAQINDDEMAPWFIKGDILGGILINQEDNDLELEKSQNNSRFPILVRCESGRYVPRWPKRLNGEWIFLSNQKFAEQFASISIAFIKVHLFTYPRN